MSSPISGFTAIPNPQMLAFMPIQSYLMMYFAGAGWQIGKRKISAIPNDQFNKMSAKDLLEGFTADLRSTIPTLERSLKDITPLIATLIEQYGEFVTIALKEIPKAAVGVLESQLTKEGTLSKLIIEVVSGGGTTTGGGAGSEALLFAKFQLQAEVDRLKIEADEKAKEELFNPPDKPFQGPEINPKTGETTPFVAAVKSLPPPASHIVSRSTSNLSIQSIKLEVQHLEDIIRQLALRLEQEQARTGQAVTTKRARVNAAFNQLQTAKQNLANFLKMHGSRL